VRKQKSQGRTSQWANQPGGEQTQASIMNHQYIQRGGSESARGQTSQKANEPGGEQARGRTGKRAKKEDT